VGLSETALDRSADPCQDFYQFACGGWLANTEIPSDRSRWVRSFNVIAESNEAFLRQVLDQAAQGSDDPTRQRLGRFYGACMDEASVERQGLAPIEPLLRRARTLKTWKDVWSLTADLHGHGIWVFWDFSAAQDFKDATQVIGYLDHAGLGLPERGYYFDDDKQDIRDAYVAHIERMLVLAGYRSRQARVAVRRIMRQETRLAEVSLARVDRRDPYNLYHRIDRAGVEATVSKFPWDDYFATLGQGELQAINVTHVPFFERVQEVFEDSRPSRLRDYFAWHVLRSTAETLPKAFDDEAFSFRQVLTGVPEQLPRWKRCVAATDGALGELLAQPFVEARFAGDSKTAAESYVRAISEAFRANLSELEWMDDASRRRAETKLDRLAFLIGYPPKWKQYDFEITDAYATNQLQARRWRIRDDLAQIGRPVDRDRWYMTPPTVNAYYSGLKNQMVFPAGILQPPFYSVDAAVAVNLGAMGFVVGHELTHGFDDQGSKFDAYGNLQPWWSEDIKQAFESRTQCVKDQYASYEPVPGIRINGQLTLGENIADLGGLKLAFSAYRALRADAVAQVASGFTEDQQFFLASAQIWCAKTREEEAKLRLQTDPHSPPRYRVNGPLSNLPQFAQAFSCAEGTPMHPTRTCEVW
jgi:putative endopeptidase